jgi:hypothetical protein
MESANIAASLEAALGKIRTVHESYYGNAGDAVGFEGGKLERLEPAFDPVQGLPVSSFD